MYGQQPNDGPYSQQQYNHQQYSQQSRRPHQPQQQYTNQQQQARPPVQPRPIQQQQQQPQYNQPYAQPSTFQSTPYTQPNNSQYSPPYTQPQQQYTQQPVIPPNTTAAPKPNNNDYGAPFSSDMFNNPSAQIGMQLGSNVLQQGQTMVNENINRYVNIPHLKYYFNVSNHYVFNKIRLLVFPFRHKHWTRLVRRSELNGQMEGYKVPREDINAPDIYIPAMSFVTYVLLFGISRRLKNVGEFSPDLLGMKATTAFFTILGEICLLKLGCYLLNVSSEVPLLDLVAYCGYIFVALNTTLLVKMLNLGSMVEYSIFGYLMVCFGFYTLRTLKYIVLPDSSTTSVSASPQRKRKIHFLFIVAAVQILFAWFLI